MKKREQLAALLMALVLMLTMASCGSSGDGTKQAVMSSAAAMAPMEGNGEARDMMEEANPDIGAEEVTDGSGVPATPPQNNRKLIRTVFLDVETKEYDKISTDISAKIAASGGYIERSEQRGASYGYNNTRSAYIVARIPKDKVDDFITMVGTQGNIINREESVEDVTLQYVDIESHKKSLLIEQERLLALLEKAEKLEDIITLEERLSSVRYQLEKFESSLRSYDNQVDYSTVTINLAEVERITVVEEKTLWSRMTTGFQRSIYDIGETAQNLAVWFVINLPYLLIWLAIVGLIVLVILRASKPRKKPVASAQQWRAPGQMPMPMQTPPQTSAPVQKAETKADATQPKDQNK